MKESIRVAVIDNHRLFRDCVAETLNETTDLKVVAAGERGSDAVQIAQDVLPEIMLLDLNMPEGGIESAREISTICPYVKTVILTSCDTAEHLDAIKEAGVRAYITKGVSGTALAEALQDVHRVYEPMLDEVCAYCGRRQRLLHHNESERRQVIGKNAEATATTAPAGSGEHPIEQEECILRREFAARKKGGTISEPQAPAYPADDVTR
jgi:DNA-binding NarL/FixJ family response regulator